MPAKTETLTLIQALTAVQAELKDPLKEAENPAYKRDGKPMRYADLLGYLEAVRPALAKHGVFMSQGFDQDTVHSFGTSFYLGNESLRLGVIVVADIPSDPQKLGSLTTYLRRYSLAAALGLAGEDDDANAASGATTAPPAKRSAPSPRMDKLPLGPPSKPGDLGSRIIAFGGNKGKTWREVAADGGVAKLAWYRTALQKSVDDPEKEKYRDKNAQELADLVRFIAENSDEPGSHDDELSYWAERIDKSINLADLAHVGAEIKAALPEDHPELAHIRDIYASKKAQHERDLAAEQDSDTF